jgi:hypothetical protein
MYQSIYLAASTSFKGQDYGLSYLIEPKFLLCLATIFSFSLRQSRASLTFTCSTLKFPKILEVNA